MANILLVDDSPDILDALTYILKDLHGYEVRTATSAKYMMQELESFKPDVILLDVLLSGEDGRDICKGLKEDEQTKHIPVILMSASDKMLKNYEEWGANDTIAKPFHLAEITDKIKSVLKVLPALFLNLHEFSHNIMHHL